MRRYGHQYFFVSFVLYTPFQAVDTAGCSAAGFRPFSCLSAVGRWMGLSAPYFSAGYGLP